MWLRIALIFLISSSNLTVQGYLVYHFLVTYDFSIDKAPSFYKKKKNNNKTKQISLLLLCNIQCVGLCLCKAEHILCVFRTAIGTVPPPPKPLHMLWWMEPVISSFAVLAGGASRRDINVVSWMCSSMAVTWKSGVRPDISGLSYD